MKQRDHALGARIKAAMKAAGFKTAKQFCEKYKIPYLTFAQHIQGRRNPTSEFLKLYSKAFGVTMNWLKTGEGNPLLKNVAKKNTHQKKIDKAFQEEMKPFQSNSMINPELLSLVLEEVIQLKTKYQFSEKKCADIAANLYTQIFTATQDRALRKKMILAFIKTYDVALKT